MSLPSEYDRFADIYQVWTDTAASTAAGAYAFGSSCVRPIGLGPLPFETKRPARPADERVVVPPAGSGSPSRSGHPDGLARGPLVARYRAPTARLASDLRSRRARAARTVPRSLEGRPDLLLSVLAVKARVYTGRNEIRAGASQGYESCLGTNRAPEIRSRSTGHG